MSKQVKLKRGFDIRLVGKAEKKVGDYQPVKTFAIKPTDFIGMQRPKVLVKEGDTVKAGTPILFDKKLEKVKYVAPVSGEIIEIKRGEKRKLLEIKILADGEINFENFEKLTSSEIKSAGRDTIIDKLTSSGVWPQIIQRPYGIVANPDDNPRAIFISGFDSHPLAPDYDYILKGQSNYFQAGIDALKKLTDGKVYLGLSADSKSTELGAIQGVETTAFSGPHPAGNVGVQIHNTAPINKGETLWTVNPYGVVQIGKLLINGIYDASKLVAITGSEVKAPSYAQTYIGSCVDSYVAGNTKSNHFRVISGNVLTGEKISQEGYLGYYQHQITVIPEGDYYEFMGWMKPTTDKLSFHKALGLLSFLFPKKEYALDSNVRGEPRAFVQTGVFEKVTPMDIYPVYLLKAIMAEDFDEMEELGIYEVIEEDLALCEFVDVSKHPVQQLIRKGIELIQYS
ncbi:Na(+)-translocating NADH-quinone reductase subunit A [Cyclobacterium sediminis]